MKEIATLRPSVGMKVHCYAQCETHWLLLVLIFHYSTEITACGGCSGIVG
jgi:hypothetical protein